MAEKFTPSLIQESEAALRELLQKKGPGPAAQALEDGFEAQAREFMAKHPQPRSIFDAHNT